MQTTRYFPIWMLEGDEVEAFTMPDDVEMALYTQYEMQQIERERRDIARRAAATRPAPIAQDVTLITEDWFTGYIAKDELTPDALDQDALDAHREYVRSLGSDFEMPDMDELAMRTRDEVQSDEATLAWLLRSDIAGESGMTERRIIETYVWTPEQRVEAAFQAEWITEAERDARIEELQAERLAWRERMTTIRREELHRALVEWFGTTAYKTRQVVVSWKQDANGRWTPDERLGAYDWIRAEIAKRDGDVLSAYASCNRIIRKRIAARKGRKVAASVQAQTRKDFALYEKLGQ